ncbi:MAG: hypothetical protein A2Y62_02205 [Candidatus Fischerbacteria bacterium RBG_13_37_8]|uniref:Uncharacterized protein n=1 Tax=Candidatus Fischerbacteria bacterium RBG_13_37_8 TaxID=1817863 RepID=A0A1F5VL28_9BACT|nr:MAG: hypothetical protein A2Y62_02205 [Candidatus Fischerbacteria bacterium RBG_13_37_8]
MSIALLNRNNVNAFPPRISFLGQVKILTSLLLLPQFLFLFIEILQFLLYNHYMIKIDFSME